MPKRRARQNNSNGNAKNDRQSDKDDNVYLGNKKDNKIQPLVFAGPSRCALQEINNIEQMCIYRQVMGYIARFDQHCC